MYKFIRLNIGVKPDNEAEYKSVFEDEYELVAYYLSAMYKNGQVMYDYVITRCGVGYMVYCTVPNVELLEERFNNEYVSSAYKFLNVSVEALGDNLDFIDDCSCEKPSWYLLYADYESSDDESPLKCGDCGFDIPLYQTPYLFGEKEHLTLLNYRRIYKSVDILWMESLSDRYTKNQLTNTKSSLVKLGRDICSALEAQLGAPVYLFVRNPIGGWYNYDKNNIETNVCPECGGILQDSLNDDLCGKMCLHCRLAFNKPSSRGID